MQTSTKIKLARVGVVLLVRHRSVRKVAGFVVKRKLRSVQASSPYLPDPPAPRRNRAAVIVAVAGGGVVLVSVLRKRSGGSGDPVPASSPVAPPETVAAPAAFVPPVDTPGSSDSAAGAPPVPAETAATDVEGGDDALVARVETELFGGEQPLAISVRASSGVVTLVGAISDQDAALKLVRDAERVDGVRAVQSELEIQGAN